MLNFTPRMILKSFELPINGAKESGEFIIGSGRVPRVTVLSQQVRAIYLVKSLIAQKRIVEDTKVAIIGGGVAGTTAACFLLKAGAKVTLFERESDVLMRFKAAKHRLIHPHLYDWPRPGWDDQEARVPHMNWRFGSAA